VNIIIAIHSIYKLLLTDYTVPTPAAFVYVPEISKCIKIENCPMETYYIFCPYYYVYNSTTGTSTERGLHYIPREIFFQLIDAESNFLNWKAIVWKTFVEHIMFAVNMLSRRARLPQYSTNRIIIISTIARVGIYRYEIIFYFHWVWFEYKLSPPPSQNQVTSRIRLWRSERVVTSYNYMLYCRSRNHGRERTTNYRRCLYSDTANRMNNIIWYSPTVRLNRFYNVQL